MTVSVSGSATALVLQECESVPEKLFPVNAGPGKTGANVNVRAASRPGTGRRDFQCHPSGNGGPHLPEGLKIAFNALMLNVLNLHIRIKMPIFVYEVGHFVLNMGKDMIIKMLQEQLEAANAVNFQLNMTVSNLNATVSELRATVKGMEQTISNLEALLKDRDASLSKAKSQMRGLSKMVENKSERQKASPAEAKTEEERQAERERKAAERKARGNNGAKRDMHFEMKTVEKDIYPDGAADGQKAVFDRVRDVVRYIMIPPQFIKEVLHIHTIKAGDRLVSARAPQTPIQNSSFDGSFIAGIAQLRYLYSMPVERIVNYFSENGFNLDKQTAHGLLKKTAFLFENLHRAMRSAVKEDNYICADETYHKVLVNTDENAGKGIRKGYIWVILAAHLGLTYFFYDNGSRSEEVILKELGDYSGTIQSDGLKAYKKVEATSGGKVRRLACLQHCKRDFLDMKGNPDADRILELCNDIYGNERKHKIGENGWTAEDNLKWRQEYAPQILEDLKAALLKVQAQTDKYPPKSQMQGAANYFLNEWDGIEAIPTAGDYAWDNNQIERINRYVSLSRKNSLFFGSHAGAERGCVFYSLACSCRLHRINFFEYLSDLLNRMAEMPNGTPVEAYRNLLPDKWTKKERSK